MSTLIYVAIPIFVATMWLEWTLARRRGDVRGYEGRDTAASLAMGIGNVVIAALVKAGTLGLYAWLHRFALFDIEPVGVAWVAVIVGDDFCYYWFHRAHHEVRLLWAAHVNHHSSRRYNLSTALRQSWTTPFTGVVFWAPLAVLGFPPLMILTAQGLSLLYQYWIHTELIGRLGPLEAVLNTPSHHRVHHGRNVTYLDRNYGGILIVWDRLFGSFEPEVERVDYGITRNIETYNPVRIAFHEFAAIGRDVTRARSVGEALGRIFRRPGWSPDGSTRTARQLQEARLAATRP